MIDAHDLVAEKLKKLMVFEYESADGRIREFRYVYGFCYDGADGVLLPQPDEIEQLVWLPLSEIFAKVTGAPDWVHLGYEPAVLERIGELCQSNQ